MRRIALFPILAAAALAAASAPAGAEVSVETRNDVYILPVAELASTKTYPDIITLRNDLLQVQLVPNRGRVMLELTSRKLGVNFLHRNLIPDPMILASGLHGVEFGGYYFSPPWNTRDRQPFDLQYEIRDSGPKQAEIYLHGRDMFLRTLTECWVRLKDGSPLVEVEVAVTNTSKSSEKEFDLKDYALFTVDTMGREGNTLILPIDTVEVISSNANWLGAAGTRKAWSGELQRWQGIRDFFQVRTFQPVSKPCLGVYYPELKAACVKFWEPADRFPVVEAWTWGESYKSVKGSGPYFGVSSVALKIKVKPQEKIGFTTYFMVLHDMPAVPTVEDLYAAAQEFLK